MCNILLKLDTFSDIQNDVPSSKTNYPNKHFKANKDDNFKKIDFIRNFNETTEADDKIINDTPEEKVKMMINNLPKIIKYINEKKLTCNVRYFNFNYASLIHSA
jgi:hypothetical protein